VRHALSRYRSRYAGDLPSAKKLLAVGDAPQASNLPCVDRAAWMLVCSSLMNTDEFLSLH
jgi:hypothetical protein